MKLKRSPKEERYCMSGMSSNGEKIGWRRKLKNNLKKKSGITDFIYLN